MSAGTSGYVLPFTIVAPTSADLDDFEFGRRVYQINSRFYSAQPQFSEWYVSQKNSDDPRLVTPLQARYISRGPNVTPQRLRADFIFRPRVI